MRKFSSADDDAEKFPEKIATSSSKIRDLRRTASFTCHCLEGSVDLGEGNPEGKQRRNWLYWERVPKNSTPCSIR
jgi:hypothetical protein